MATKVHPSPPNALSQTVKDALSQIVKALADVKPDYYEALKQSLLENPAALRTLEGAGFVPPDSEQKPEQKKHDAQLPAELLGFTILKNMPSVAKALAKASFQAAQKAVQDPDKVNGDNVLAELQSEVMAVQTAYKDAIAKSRVKEDNIKVTCRKVIEAGNKDFKGVYGQVWQRIPRNERRASKRTNQLSRIYPYSKLPRVKRPKIHAFCISMPAAVKPVYASFVSSLVGDMPAQASKNPRRPEEDGAHH